MEKRTKRLLLVMAALAVINVLGLLQITGLLPAIRTETERVTVFEHGKTLQLDSQLLLYRSLLYQCERAVKNSSERSSAGADLASRVASGRQGDAVEIVYAAPRELMAASRTIAVDHVFIPLSTVSKDSITAFVGHGGYQEAVVVTDRSAGPRLNDLVGDLATIQYRRIMTSH